MIQPTAALELGKFVAGGGYALPAVDAVPAPQTAHRLLGRGGVVELQVVWVHAVEAQRSAQPVDLQPDLVFASAGQLRGLDRTQGARLRLRQEHYAVLDVDRAHFGRIIGRGALGVGDLRGGHDRPQRANEPIGQIQHVRTQIGDGPAPGRGREPPLQRQRAGLALPPCK